MLKYIHHIHIKRDFYFNSKKCHVHFISTKSLFMEMTLFNIYEKANDK